MMRLPAVHHSGLNHPCAVLSHFEHKVQEVTAVIGHAMVGPGNVLHVADVTLLIVVLYTHKVESEVKRVKLVDALHPKLDGQV